MKLTKHLLAPFFVIILGLVLLVNNFWPAPIPRPTPQRRTTHMLTFYQYSRGIFGIGSGTKESGLCTGSAVGPHAILTARHCDQDGESRVLRLDLSTYQYHILAAMSDNRDHLILLIDGPALTNVIPYQKLVDVRPVGRYESVYVWGNGEGAYPAFYHTGRMARDSQDVDVSEVDRKQGLIFYDFPVIPGDSGSAIYGQDGRVVGVVTYRIGDDYDAKSAGFTLNFTVEQIHFAEIFSPLSTKDGEILEPGLKLPVPNPPQP